MYIQVKAKNGQRVESITETKPGRFEVSIKERPERGLANKRILEMVREHFGGASKNVKIINGHHTKTKLIKIEE